MAVNPDQTWHSPLLCIWSAVELNVAIICSCAPTLRCLIQRFWPKFLNSVVFNYASRQRSDREDSAATTAVNSNSNVSRNSFFKPGNNSQVEGGAGSKKASDRLQAFRRSLSKPFTKGNCDGDNNSAIDLTTYNSEAPSGKVSLQHARDIEVEVEVVVEQSSDIQPGDYSKPSEWRPC
jgi:hypothetical protein